MSDFALLAPAPSRRPAWRVLTGHLLLGAAWWTIFLLALEPGNLLRAAGTGHPLPFGPEALRITGASLLGAASAPAVLLLTRHFPFEGAGRWRNAGTQAAGIAALTIILIVISCLLAASSGVGNADILRQLVENGPIVAFCLAGFFAVANALQPRRQDGSRNAPDARRAGKILRPVKPTAVLSLASALQFTGRRSVTATREDAGAPPVPAGPYLAEIPVKTRGGLLLVSLDEVDWMETQGNYLAVHAGASVHLIRETSTRLEMQLDPDRFVRVHRQTLVALDRIRELRHLRGGDAELRLVDGTCLRLSRSYRAGIQSRLQGSTSGLGPAAAELAMGASGFL